MYQTRVHSNRCIKTSVMSQRYNSDSKSHKIIFRLICSCVSSGDQAKNGGALKETILEYTPPNSMMLVCQEPGEAWLG